MGRKCLMIFIIGLLILPLGGCSWWENAYERAAARTFKVNVLIGPTVVGMIKLMEPTIKPSLRLGDTVEYVIEQSPDTLYAKLLAGEIEIAAIPTDMAAKLYNNGGAYQLMSVHNGGAMYVVTNGVTIHSWSDLKGQEVQIAGKGAISDVVFRYLLFKNRINPDKDLTLKYTDSQEVLAQMAIAGSTKITVLSEPWVSKVLSKNRDMKIALDMQEEWTLINGAEIPLAQTCLVVKAEAAARNSETLNLFLKDYADSIDWVNKNPAAASKLAAKHDIGMPEEEVAEVSITRCNLRYLSVKDGKPGVEKYLQVLLDFSPDSIGGKLPDANFYYER